MNDTAPDDLALRRKRLRYRSWRRGMKEVDLLLGGFADAHLDAMSEAELDRYEGLLAKPDPDIFSWVVGSVAPPKDIYPGLIEMIRNIRNNK